MTRVFSGIQPTGAKHIGNWLGAIRHYVEDQETYGSESIFCVVDLHSMTVPYDPADLRAWSLDTAAILIAAGLDPERCILFLQGQVSAHSELAWILNCVATMGELGRMTQFKSKSEGRDSVTAGLHVYPVLMAADVLVYKADRVPVGEDQRQHLELMRDLAERFNNRFGKTFPLPEPAIAKTAGRVRDLQDPAKRMSTTQSSEEGKILVLDAPETILKKFKRAVTDSGSEIVARDDKPGIANLLDILSAMTGTPVPALEAGYVGKGYGALKVDVAEAVIEGLRPIRERYGELIGDRGELARLLDRGAERAREIADPVLAEVRERVGLVGSVA
ncbi:MAG TPA: tryptophan--tRNA ligase [Gaiellales bacterium]|jgi:tryptophanyl-tRNA synthetase